MESASVHSTIVEIGGPLQSELQVGSVIALPIAVSCRSGCDLRGRPVTVTAPSGSTVTAELSKFDDQANKTEGDAMVTVPSEVGVYIFQIAFLKDESPLCVHEGSCTEISIVTKPHPADVVVWGITSPPIIETSFKVNLGVKCLSGCQLAGNLVEILNEEGKIVGEGRLGDKPWPGTDSLYWASVDVVAPPRESVFFWTARFASIGSTLAHEDRAARFSFRAVGHPEHKVAVRVVGKTTGLPIEGAEVWAGPFQSLTDNSGMAIIELPKGTYTVGMRKEGYGIQPVTVDVRADLAVLVEADRGPTKAVVEGPVGPHHPYRD